MLKMRLQRVGRKHEPSFRLVLTDSKNSTKSGRIEEILGSYDPRKSTEAFKAERIKHWISQGIGLTPSVNNLLIRQGIIRGKKIHVSKVPPLVEPTTDPSIELGAGDLQPTTEPTTEEAPAAEAEVPVESPVEEVPTEAPAKEAAPAVEEAPTEASAEEVKEEPATPAA
ncbi:MAG: 30S ribosomal protein S16 [Candidatus Roizmanbacteria bacterium]|nr:30S ribosomal protein S16 [Candidatus Roizmanbacteria bacterium]